MQHTSIRQHKPAGVDRSFEDNGLTFQNTAFRLPKVRLAELVARFLSKNTFRVTISSHFQIVQDDATSFLWDSIERMVFAKYVSYVDLVRFPIASLASIIPTLTIVSMSFGLKSRSVRPGSLTLGQIAKRNLVCL